MLVIDWKECFIAGYLDGVESVPSRSGDCQEFDISAYNRGYDCGTKVRYHFEVTEWAILKNPTNG